MNKPYLCPLCKGADWIDLKTGKPGICPKCKGKKILISRFSKAELKTRRNDNSRATAYRANYGYTEKEIDIVLNSKLTTKQLAKKLGRSIKSVETMKYRLRKAMKETNG